MRSYESSAATLETPATESVAASFRTASSGSGRHPPSAQNGTGTCEQFPKAKGFGDVIVGTEFEANDTIHFVRYVAGHDDRNIAFPD